MLVPCGPLQCHLKMLQLLRVVDTVKKMKVESHLHSVDDGDTGLVFKELNNMANIIECYSSFPHVLKVCTFGL